ncbi:GTPase [Algoriphagus lacus]|uniref:GTPase n=1 Tax=Algoriphagus lacus TaxID=2056311 RepID=A0A418PNI5_9BACT|nr:GTPase [Algoriphagus lacus]RIW13313.1 GTPase [Algoriphagus lacus]
MVGKISDPVNPGTPKVYFIYNANSGKFNAYLDMLHKVISPKTYPCQLCDITYGVSKIRPAWKEFREKSKLYMIFLHKDEWEEAFPENKIVLPAVLLDRGKGLEVIFGSKDWNRVTLEDLMDELTRLESQFFPT